MSVLAATLRAVQTVYDLSLDDDAWMGALCQSIAPVVDQGMSVSLSEYSVDADHQTRITRYVQQGGDDDFSSVAAEFQQLLPPSWVQSVYMSPGYVGRAFSEASVLTQDEILVASQFLRERTKIRDIFGAAASWDSGCGMSLAAPMAVAKDLAPDRLSSVRHVLAHVRCASRLRARLAEAPDDAIIDANSGRIVHAEGAATSPSAQEKLRAQARAIDHANTAGGRRDPEAALQAWKGLVDGTWTLVDNFDTDGRHYIVAKRNAPQDVSVGRLGPRERQCAILAASGASDKLIGYELGLSPSTVATHLQRARARLGCASRVALCRIALGAWREEVAVALRRRTEKPIVP